MDVLGAPGEPDGQPDEPRRGPFAVESGDALVYRDTGDSPELRATAVYARIGPRIRVSQPRPQRRQPRPAAEWTPGGRAHRQERPPARSTARIVAVVRVAVVVVITLVPVVAGWLLLQLGLAAAGR